METRQSDTYKENRLNNTYSYKKLGRETLTHMETMKPLPKALYT